MHTLSSIIKYRMKKDEEDIQAVMRAIQSFIVPFDDDGEELVSLMSGSVASPIAQDDLLSVRTQGEKRMYQFIEQRIQSTAVDFFAPIKAAKLSTFVPVKGNKSNQQAKADIHANDRSLFA